MTQEVAIQVVGARMGAFLGVLQVVGVHMTLEVGVQVQDLQILLGVVGAMKTIGCWNHYWDQMVGVQILGVVGVHHIQVGAFHIHRFLLLRHHPIVHLVGVGLPYLGVVGACSNFHLMMGVVLYRVVGVDLQVQDPNYFHSHLVVEEEVQIEDPSRV